MAKYSHTEFVWNDQSKIPPIPETIDNTPLFLIAMGTDTGEETLTRVKGPEFYKKFGFPSSKKYGIAADYADRIIQSGGELFIKRIVASDATLSNIVICVEVENTTIQKRNANGELLYTSATDQSETTESGGGNTPLMINTCKLKWIAKNINSAKSVKDVESEAIKLRTGNTYPVFWLADLGRNADHLKFNLTADHSITKRFGEMFYTLKVMNGGATIDEAQISFNPDAKAYGTKSLVISFSTLNNANIGYLEESYKALLTAMSAHNKVTELELMSYDLINGKTYRGEGLQTVTLDNASNNFSDIVGISFAGGSDGSEFGTEGHKHAKFTEKLKAFFSGSTDTAIFDIEQHPIFACIDCEYPKEVQTEIIELVEYRQDFVFLRDCGINNNTHQLIINAVRDKYKTKFASDFGTAYSIVNKENKLSTVSCLYDLIPVMIYNYRNNPARPLAGEANDAVCNSALPGTVNFIPVNTKTVKQKELFDDARINYAAYTSYKGKLVMQKLYTSQEEHTQLSYLNNVMAVQAVMRAIRAVVPRNRFTLQKGNDFSGYARIIDTIIENMSSMFYKLEFRYVQDDIMAQNKIFTGEIVFQFNGWVEAEHIALYAQNVTSGN